MNHEKKKEKKRFLSTITKKLKKEWGRPRRIYIKEWYDAFGIKCIITDNLRSYCY